MARILLMDDEAPAREAMQRIVESRGHEVLAFDDARPALSSVDFDVVDAAIVDLQMPTSGYDAIEEIRARGYTDLPIVVVSAYVDLELTPELLGVQSIVRKPFKATQVADAVDSVLR